MFGANPRVERDGCHQLFDLCNGMESVGGLDNAAPNATDAGIFEGAARTITKNRTGRGQSLCVNIRFGLDRQERGGTDVSRQFLVRSIRYPATLHFAAY